MSEDNDVSEMWKEIKKAKQLKHTQQKQINSDLLGRSGLYFQTVNDGECLLFRDANKPKVDFYPSSGRWRFNRPYNDHRTGKPRQGVCNGGAKSFINWYKKQKNPL